MKFKLTNHFHLAAIEKLERQEIMFSDYGLLCWMKNKKTAVDVYEMIQVAGLIAVNQSVCRLRLAKLIEEVKENSHA